MQIQEINVDDNIIIKQEILDERASPNEILLQISREFTAAPDFDPEQMFSEYVKVDPPRFYKTGKDKHGKTRLWIDAPDDNSKVFLFRLNEEESTPEVDVFVCGHCSRHKRITKLAIRHMVTDGDFEQWEQVTHYPSCYRLKSDVEAIQMKYDKPYRTSSRQNRNHSAECRVVSQTDYVFGVGENGTWNTQIMVRDETDRNLGRVYAVRATKSTGAKKTYFCCSCNPRKSAFVTVENDENGVLTVREAPLARHEDHCEATTFDELIQKQKELEEKFTRKRIAIAGPSRRGNGSGNNNKRSKVSSRGVRKPKPPSVAPQRAWYQPPPTMHYIPPRVLPHMRMATPFMRVLPTQGPYTVSTVPPSSSAPRLGQLSASSVNTVSTTTQSPSTNAVPYELDPIVLPVDRTMQYNVPSSSEMRNSLKILGLEYSNNGLAFWSEILKRISEFRGSSRPNQVQPIKLRQLSGFASLALFLTGNEENAFEIQEAVKRHFFQHFYKTNKMAEDTVRDALVSSDLTDAHITIFARMINCAIGVFDENQLKIYGNPAAENLATILLKREGKQYSPVLNLFL